ncbi:protein-export membrane protein SecD [Actinomyces sp. Chiba101]|uniref:protein translocase subunit SecD n=1 Tax=Actinomyces TaxID=1654 RepID=UPI000974EA3B|nr:MULTISPECIES: protein translocase subunit SecD [Actinomyces]BAW93215.1 protein-export membrane protein SecD [Actinomyces sp. Chiba101]GAV95549.1 protein-export membrane protein SecD [Actinomyces denticolens]SUU04326.1 preprotein translocase subunit SecD [Actinomyces denticolens]
MPTKKTKRPGARILLLLLILAVGFGALAFGSATKRTTMTPGLALDLEGGTQIILTPTTTDGSEISDEDVNQAIEVIRQRVDASGVAEAQISRQGGQNIVVALPGTPSEATLDLVRKAAVLYFRPVIRIIQGNATQIAEQRNQLAAQQNQAAPAAPTDAAATDAASAPSADPSASPTIPTTTPEQVATQAADVNGDGTISEDPLPATSDDNSSDAWITEKMIYDATMLDCTAPENLTGEAQDPSKAVISCDKQGNGTAYILGPADIAGTDIATAVSGTETTEHGGTTNNWGVSVEFNSTGTDQFAAVSERLLAYRDAARAAQRPAGANGAPTSTTDSQKARFAIVLDGLTIMSSGFRDSVTSPITDGRVRIDIGQGGEARAQSNTLANQLSFGALPINFTVQSEQQISATLGTEQLRNGLIAGFIGFLLIIVYLAWQYRGLSLVAVASLIIAAVGTYLVIALLSWFIGYRLSLAGVAGLIISIGITMDSFIIYFERVRDEVRNGRTLIAAVDEGWKHARQTIVVSDAVNLVASVVLYVLAVGGVQGFAFTLGVTTVVDLAVIFGFTHPLMVWILRFRFFGEGHRLSGLDPEHLGARSLATYGKGRDALIEGAAGSLARRKALARRGGSGGAADGRAAIEGDDAVDSQAHDGKDGESK